MTRRKLIPMVWYCKYCYQRQPIDIGPDGSQIICAVCGYGLAPLDEVFAAGSMRTWWEGICDAFYAEVAAYRVKAHMDTGARFMLGGLALDAVPLNDPFAGRKLSDYAKAIGLTPKAMSHYRQVAAAWLRPSGARRRHGPSTPYSPPIPAASTSLNTRPMGNGGAVRTPRGYGRPAHTFSRFVSTQEVPHTGHGTATSRAVHRTLPPRPTPPAAARRASPTSASTGRSRRPVLLALASAQSASTRSYGLPPEASPGVPDAVVVERVEPGGLPKVTHAPELQIRIPGDEA